jgi:hypothetical protein
MNVAGAAPMLSTKWRELELLNERVARLKEQYAVVAQREGSNHGLAENLRRELMSLQDRQEELVAQISKQLGETLT